MEITPIPGFPGYGASRNGDVWTKWTRENGRFRNDNGDLILNGGGWFISNKWEKLNVTMRKVDGRRVVNIHKSGSIKQKVYLVAPLILLTFKGPRPNRLICRHIDDDNQNDNDWNLEWGTDKDNKEDQKRNGTRPSGESHGRCKVSDSDCKKIIFFNKFGLSQRKIAKIFNITQTHVSYIVNKKSRKYLHI